MKSRMQPRHYLSEAVFERERDRIFRRLWLFAGLKTMVAEHNDFITREVAGVPVVIQNFRGELRAFENVCLHRSMRLQTAPAGRRPLVCGYHGWSYAVDGSASHIPLHDELYRFPAAERDAMRLRQFALRAVGNLLFVNLDPDPLPITDQFDQAFIDLMESSSSMYDTEVMTTTWHTRFNWKLGYENLRDGNHPRFVHPQSITKNVVFVPLMDEALHAEVTPELDPSLDRTARREILRRFSYGGAEGSFKNVVRYDWQQYVERWGETDAYFNWLAYPNLHIASSDGGFSFTIEHHVPVAPDRTDLEIYWMTARKRQPYSFSGTVLLSLMHGSKLVVGEDVQVMEEVQRGLHADAPTPRQGDYEGLNKRVERWYVDLIDGDHEI
ncbi:MAG: Rieske 2Fe-2S domain-containing protein [Burkholderiales bacterium]|nr:Rieske 2Fe-2S domain-containing protein [Burkholderiales bacterium]